MSDFFKIRLKNGQWVPLISYVGMLGVSFLYKVLCGIPLFPPFSNLSTSDFSGFTFPGSLFVLAIALVLTFSLPMFALLYLLPFWGIRSYYKGHDTTFSILSLIFLFIWVCNFFLCGAICFSDGGSTFKVYSLSLLLVPLLLAYFSMDERADLFTYIKLSSCYSGYLSIFGLSLLSNEFFNGWFT